MLGLPVTRLKLV